MLTVHWPSLFTPSMTRMRQRGRRTQDLPADSEREPILEKDRAPLMEVKEGVEADQEEDPEEVLDLVHPPDQGQDQEELRQATPQAKEEVELVPLEGETLRTVALLEAGQEQEGVSLSIPLVRMDPLAEEAAPVARDKEEVAETP